MAGPLTFLTYLFRPLSTLLIRSTSLISKRMAKKDGLSMDQLSKALELTEDAEINDEKDILEGIVRFSNIAAIDIIRPRINIIALDIEDSFEVVKNVVIEHGIPACRYIVKIWTPSKVFCTSKTCLPI